MQSNPPLQHRTLQTTIAVAATALLLGACAAPHAPGTATAPPQPAGGHGQAAFMGSYDGNRDGIVTRAEYDAIRKQRFEAGDANRDGVLNEAEYVDEFEQRLKQQYFNEGRQPDKAYEGSIKQAHVRFAILDRDRDGKLSREEDLTVADKTFKSADTNGDGVVSRNDPPAERSASGGNTAP